MIRQFVIALITCAFHASASADPFPELRYPGNQFPLDAAHLSLQSESAFLAPAQTFAFDLNGAWTNTFVYKRNYTVDAESRELQASVRYTFDANWESRIDLPIEWRGGGVLDRFLRSWHNFWGFPKGKRDRVDNDDFDISGTRTDGLDFRWSDQGIRLGNVKIGNRLLVSGGPDRALTLLTEVSLPTSHGTFGHAGIDLDIALEWSRRWTDWQMHAGLGAIAFTDESIEEIKFLPLHAEGYLAADYNFFRGLWANVGTYFGQQPATNVRAFPEGFAYLDFGLTSFVTDHLQTSAIIRENPWPARGTSDVSFFLMCKLIW